MFWVVNIFYKRLRGRGPSARLYPRHDGRPSAGHPPARWGTSPVGSPSCFAGGPPLRYAGLGDDPARPALALGFAGKTGRRRGA